MVSSTNERQIRERKAQALKDREISKTIVGALMSSRDGRRWVWLRLSEAQLFDADLTLEHAYMAFEKGRKQFALQLLRDVNRFAPNEYIIMTRENTGVDLDTSLAEDNEDE